MFLRDQILVMHLRGGPVRVLHGGHAHGLQSRVPSDQQSIVAVLGALGVETDDGGLGECRPRAEPRLEVSLSLRPHLFVVQGGRGPNVGLSRVVVEHVRLLTVPLQFLQHPRAVHHNGKRLNALQAVRRHKLVERAVRQHFQRDQAAAVSVRWRRNMGFKCAIEQAHRRRVVGGDPAPLSARVLREQQRLAFVVVGGRKFCTVSGQGFVSVGGDQTSIGQGKVSDGAHGQRGSWKVNSAARHVANGGGRHAKMGACHGDPQIAKAHFDERLVMDAVFQIERQFALEI